MAHSRPRPHNDDEDQSREILLKVGSALARAREERGEGLEEVAAWLRIRPPYLEAIERGDYSVFPAHPYAFGFLRAYADYLGYDGPEVVRRVRDALQAEAPKARLEVQRPLIERHRPTALGLVLAAVVVAVGAIGWYGVRGLDPEVRARLLGWPGRLAERAVERLGWGKPEPQPVVAEASRASGHAGEAPPAPGTVAESAPPASRIEPVPPPREVVLVRFEAVDEAPPVISQKLRLIQRSGDRQAQRTTSDATVANAAELRSAFATEPPLVTAALEPPAPQRERTPPRPPGLALVAIAETWIRLESQDRSYLRSRMMAPGARLPLPERDDLVLFATDAGSVAIEVGGVSIGPLGEAGEPLWAYAIRPARLRALAESR